MERIPVTITVSRETGQIVEVERGNVTKESFRKVCQALIKGGKEDGNSEPSDRADDRDDAGDHCYPDLHGKDRRLDREEKEAEGGG